MRVAAATLPVLVAVLFFPAAALAQPGAEPTAPPESQAAPEQPTAEHSMCWRGRCGPDRARRFALGVAGGHIDLDAAGEGRQKSIVGRVAFWRGFAVELELSRADLDDDGSAKTGGIALEKFFLTHRRLNPYLLVGGGGGRLERTDGSDARLAYGEIGGGLVLRGRRLALALDLRAGARRTEASVTADPGVAAAMTAPSDDDGEWERDRYHRARLMLLFQF